MSAKEITKYNNLCLRDGINFPHFPITVNLCSKGPGRKGNMPLKDISLSPDMIFSNCPLTI